MSHHKLLLHDLLSLILCTTCVYTLYDQLFVLFFVIFCFFFLLLVFYLFFFFFFQAEDGIRDGTVTGVQTCALPISRGGSSAASCRRARPRPRASRERRRRGGAPRARCHPWPSGGRRGCPSRARCRGCRRATLRTPGNATGPRPPPGRRLPRGSGPPAGPPSRCVAS